MKIKIKKQNKEQKTNGIYIDENRNIFYYKNGKIHNEDGPAYISVTGYNAHYINGKLHRIDGPAEIWNSGDHSWWLNDIFVLHVIINTWLTENDIPLDWNIWTDSDKMLFALRWSDYNG